MEVHQLLSGNYQDFLKIALDNPDLKLFSVGAMGSLIEEQRERQLIIFNMLISLFERAYLVLYEDDMTPQQARRWFLGGLPLEWCRRPDFRRQPAAPAVQRGPEFRALCGAVGGERERRLIYWLQGPTGRSR